MRQKYLQASILHLLVFLCSVTALWAQTTVTGKVTSQEDGTALPGVSVVVKGTTRGATTDGNGRYSVAVDGSNTVLVYSFIGFKSQEVTVGNRSSVDVSLEADLSALDEVVVTGYTSEKKRDIVGSVSVINAKNAVAQPAANVSSMLQGRAAGITVSGSGAPGAGAKIRIRGFVSFGNNDPLFVIDGVQTDNANSLNPQDIESIQVLKDPVSASIYGSRAANGVIVITTKMGSSGKHEITYDGYYGVQQLPDRVYPRMLNTQQYAQVLWRAFEGAGIPRDHPIFGRGAQPVIPNQLWTAMNVNATDASNAPDPSRYRVFENLDPQSYGAYQIYNTSPGTDWHREITQVAPMQMHQIGATGGGDKAQYSLGFNYFGQEGIFKHTNFERYSVRANTRFNPVKFLTIGQNMQISFTNQLGGSGNPQDLGGGLDFSGEGSPWAQAYRMVPYIPVTDINGNWGGNGMGASGNGTNPVAQLWRNRNNRFNGFNILGNVYARVNILKELTLSTSFAVDQRIGNGSSFTYITFERSENQRNNAFNEYMFRGGNWVWTNSLQYAKKFAERHDVNIFLATESQFEQFRGLSASRIDYDFSDPNFVSINTGRNLPLNGGSPSTPRALYSVFGKAQYQFDDKYLLSVTLRQDASSVFGPENRTALFPAVGAGWRISQESFMKNIPFITELKLRGGWGQMGSQRNVNPVNSFSFFGASLTGTGYDISGGNSGVVIGYRPTFVGNPATRWETATMVNLGLDGSLFNGKLDFTVEYFHNTTSGLLVDRFRNGLGPVVGQPRINVGTMINKGIDATLSTRGEVGKTGLSYDLAVTFTHYRNIAERLDADGVGFFEQGGGRLAPIQRTQAGQSLSTFWGYRIDGIFQNQQEVDAHAAMPYKRIGSWRIRDISGPEGRPDGVITNLDQTFLGSPIPVFQMGYDVVLKYKGFDLNAFFFWNYGNKIYNYTKWWTDLRGFVGGVSERALTDSWTEQNRGARLPILNANDNYSGSISTDYYLESGSFLRLRQLQLGYTIPEAMAKKVRLSRARVYIQGQNLFTITPYSGPDPDFNILGEETAMGVDQFRVPAPSIYMVGVSLGL